MPPPTPEQRAEVERLLARAAPSLATQLEIRASAIEVAREALHLEGAARRASLAEERELLDASLRASRGEPVDWPSNTSERATVDAPVQPVATSGTDPTWLGGLWCPYDAPASILDPHEGAFVEVFRFGSQRHACNANPPPAFLLQHGKNPAVGRTPVARVDHVSETVRGAHVEATLLRSRLVADHVVPVAQAGLLRASFSFYIPDAAGEVWRRSGGTVVREVLDCRVSEITCTSTPVYTSTSLQVRSWDPSRVPRGPTVARPGERRDADAWRLSPSMRRRQLARLGII
jgi:phage head maturation protease